jgi:hypothetical protein
MNTSNTTTTVSNLSSSKKDSEGMHMNTRSLWSIVYVILLTCFIYLEYVGYFIPNFEKYFFLESKNLTIYDVGLIWVPILGYVLISIEVCLIVRIIKPLKEYSEKDKGLIYLLLFGLKIGFVSGLLIFFILPINQFPGLIFGLAGGLLSGLIVGIEEEFRK